MVRVLLYSLISTVVLGVYYPPQADINAYHNARQAVKANPADVMAQFNLAMNYAYTGRVIKGINLLKEVNKTDPALASKIVTTYQSKIARGEHTWLDYFKLGFGLYFTGESDASVDAFLAAHEMVPDQVWVMGYIALILADQGEYDAAITWCQRALDYEYDLAGIHYLLGEAYSEQGESVKAFSHKARAVSLLTEEKLAHDYIYGTETSE